MILSLSVRSGRLRMCMFPPSVPINNCSALLVRQHAVTDFSLLEHNIILHVHILYTIYYYSTIVQHYWSGSTQSLTSVYWSITPQYTKVIKYTLNTSYSTIVQHYWSGSGQSLTSANWSIKILHTKVIQYVQYYGHFSGSNNFRTRVCSHLWPDARLYPPHHQESHQVKW